MKTKSKSIFTSTTFILSLILAPVAWGQTWDGDTDGAWGTAANWDGDTTPTFGTSADIIFYASGAGNLSTFLGTGRTIRSLTFNADADSNVGLRMTTTSSSTTAANLTFNTAAENASITVASGAEGNFTLGTSAHGQVFVSKPLDITHNGSGTLSISRPINSSQNITKTGDGTLIFSVGNANYSGLTTISAGTLQIGAGTPGIGAGGLGGTFGDGSETNTVTNNAAIVINRSNGVTLPNEISGIGTLAKWGTGIATLSGANTYTGATTVNAGTIALAATGSIANSATISVSTGASLDVSAVSGWTVGSSQTVGGTGTIVGNTTIEGTLSPGQSPGTLAFDNNLSIATAATYFFEGGDLTTVGGTLDLNNDWILALGTGLQDGGSIALFAYDTAGTFDLTPMFDLTSLGFTPGSSLTLTNTGSEIVLNGVSLIPEPSAALLGGLGLLALLRRRREFLPGRKG